MRYSNSLSLVHEDIWASSGYPIPTIPRAFPHPWTSLTTIHSLGPYSQSPNPPLPTTPTHGPKLPGLISTSIHPHGATQTPIPGPQALTPNLTRAFLLAKTPPPLLRSLEPLPHTHTHPPRPRASSPATPPPSLGPGPGLRSPHSTSALASGPHPLTPPVCQAQGLPCSLCGKA